ncbi:MAG: hypothetical protein WBP26_04185 [Candidatus Saccharimonadales bacterium]
MTEVPIVSNVEEDLSPGVQDNGQEQVLGGLAVEGGDTVTYADPGSQNEHTQADKVLNGSVSESVEADSNAQQTSEQDSGLPDPNEGRWEKDKAATIGWAFHDDNKKVMSRLDDITKREWKEMAEDAGYADVSVHKHLERQLRISGERELQVHDKSNLYDQLFDQNPTVFAAIQTGEFRDIVRALEGSRNQRAINRLNNMQQWEDTARDTLTWNAKDHRTLEQADVEVFLEEVSSLLDRTRKEPNAEKLPFTIAYGVPPEIGQALLQKLTETRESIGTKEARYEISAKDTNTKLIELCDVYRSAVEEGLSSTRAAFQQELERYSSFQSPEELNAFREQQKADEEARKAARTARYEQDRVAQPA